MTILEPGLFPPDAAGRPDPVPFCACTNPHVVHNLCTTCSLPNLAALLAWQFCECPAPDLEVHGLRARTCGTYGHPPRGELIDPAV